MESYFSELGRTVLARWKARNFSLAAFPEIAVHALEERPPAKNVKVPELIREFLLNDEQPFQTQSGFGQPELVVYDNPRFYIQILFWLEGTTDIHQHKFSGAFHVLEGSSIHSRFEFAEPQSISAHLKVGHLRMSSISLLEAGSTVPIVSGNQYIHSLFHLDTPSLTVVVRTHSDPGTGPQFTYLAPHIAVDPFYDDALTTRRKQLLDVLERIQDPDYSELVSEMLDSLDFERGFFILQNGRGYLKSIDRWDEVWRVFERKHGSLAEYVEPALDGIARRDGIAAIRSCITDVEHRFFLALLLNIPDRARILELVSQRYPGDARDTIVRWVEELMSTSAIEIPIIDVDIEPEVVVEKLRELLAEEAAGTSPRDPEFRDALANSILRPLVS